MEFEKSLQMDGKWSHTKYNKLWIQKWEVVEILCQGCKLQQRSEVLRHLVPGEEHTISSFTWGQVKYSVWRRLWINKQHLVQFPKGNSWHNTHNDIYFNCPSSIHWKFDGLRALFKPRSNLITQGGVLACNHLFSF